MISKFPVISTNGNHYEVDIIDRYVEMGHSVWRVNIYTKNQYLKWLRKKVSEYETSIKDYHIYKGEYKRLAIQAVRKYEYEKEHDRHVMQKHNKGIQEFQQWDGIIE